MEGVDIVSRSGAHIGLGRRRLDYDGVSVARITPSPAPAYGLARVGRDTPQRFSPVRPPLVEIDRVSSCDGWSNLEAVW